MSADKKFGDVCPIDSLHAELEAAADADAVVEENTGLRDQLSAATDRGESITIRGD